MASEISHIEPYPCSMERLYATLTDERYWRDRVATMAGGGGELISCAADKSGFRAVVRQPIPATSIPAALTRFVPSRVNVEYTESWLPRETARAAGTFVSTVISMPASIDARVELRAVGPDRCDMHFEGTVTASVPVVGAMVEKMMMAQTAEGFRIEREFTLDWLARPRV
ncbi:hypothetical protein ASG12_00650 [Williamsia sp. Leaf354]|uniref:DUF2505 domain-containing protein n=1 Tax=Williamsia sp. Leaf354 TaxID=1736349 RepID=UPI0006F57D07|nr:DUF2505 domain-containing protein [Williamsia sp. Leaf354]KQR99388.1 hypothetical protein ASG12_00650 [Williamsia sp. Leaf354]